MAATRQIFYADSYRRELSASVVAVDADWVELDQTIFYPMGGGQPGDTGIMVAPDGTTFKVVDTRKGATPGQIKHQLDSDAHGLKVGDAVHTEIDWERRFRHMRMHTSMHLLGSLIPAPVTGGAVGAKRAASISTSGITRLTRRILRIA